MTAKASNRARMPRTAEIVDDLRSVFGALPYGRFSESGHVIEWGTPPAPAVEVEPATLPSSGPWHQRRAR